MAETNDDRVPLQIWMSREERAEIQGMAIDQGVAEQRNITMSELLLRLIYAKLFRRPYPEDGR